MNRSFKKILILAHYTVHDPVTVNCIKSLAGVGSEIIVLQHGNNDNPILKQIPHLKLIKLYDFIHIKQFNALRSILRTVYYFIYLRWLMLFQRPDLVVSFMLHPLAALAPSSHKPYYLISCIFDIPPIINSGKLDKYIHRKGWSVLKYADLVWASDVYKAKLAKQLGNLNTLPVICHNAPPLSELDCNFGKRSLWLRQQLIKDGAPIQLNTGCVMIRAGAIGVYGGIEETLDTMVKLPEDFVFLMMGRPSMKYKASLLRKIEELGLQKRAILWDRPNDEVWKMAIEGADIGHLLHLKPLNDALNSEMYELNSSLSNNRLFNYLAAGLPILSYDDIRLDDIHHEINCFNVVEEKSLYNTIYYCLNNLYNNKNVRECQSEAAKSAFQVKYNWDVQFSQVFTHICSLPIMKENKRMSELLRKFIT